MAAACSSRRAGRGRLSLAQDGFTLVELAIVMTIIGLLVGGILKGQEILANARMTTTIAQLQAYRAADITFRDMYSAIPGDMSSATSRLAGCTAAANCYDGNGDGILGAVTTNYSHDNQGGSIVLPAVETSMYWKHLALANLVNGVTPNSNTLAPEWGETHPAAKMGGGFHVLYANETGNNQANGHYYIFRKQPVGDPHPVTPGLEMLSPLEAQRMDVKIDDGNAREGDVRCDDAGAQCSVAATGVYQSGSGKNCLMIISFGN